jgi:hypothetical protein
LREAPPFDGHRAAPADLSGDDRLAVETVPVGTDEAAGGEPVHLLREVRDHVSAVHLAVHGNVDADLVLEAHPHRGRFLFVLAELLAAHVALRETRACFHEGLRLRVAADRGDRQDRELDP